VDRRRALRRRRRLAHRLRSLQRDRGEVAKQRFELVIKGIFSFASLLNGLATSDTWLVTARGLQGLGGALVSPAALSIITTTFAEGEDRTKALGVWSAIAAGGGAFGLLLGGILTDLLSWEWIFFVNVPIGIATAILALRFVPESRAANREPGADLPGAITVTAGLIVLVYAIVKAEDFGWGSARTLGLAAVAFALLGAFVLIESRTRAPLIRLGIFKVRSLAGANSVLLVVMGGLFGFFFFSTLYVQLILGYSPLQAGLAFLRRGAARRVPGRVHRGHDPRRVRRAAGRHRAQVGRRERQSGRGSGPRGLTPAPQVLVRTAFSVTSATPSGIGDGTARAAPGGQSCLTDRGSVADLLRSDERRPVDGAGRLDDRSREGAGEGAGPAGRRTGEEHPAHAGRPALDRRGPQGGRLRVRRPQRRPAAPRAGQGPAGEARRPGG